MKEALRRCSAIWHGFIEKIGSRLRTKLILIFLGVKVIPIILLAALAFHQMVNLGELLKKIAVEDSSAALNASAVENIERLTTDTAKRVAAFLYDRDDDILYLAGVTPSDSAYRLFGDTRTGRVLNPGEWVLNTDGTAWKPLKEVERRRGGGESTNIENNDMNGFHYRQPEEFEYIDIPLYDEIVFIDLNGNELYKYVSPASAKVNYPLNPAKSNVSLKENTYIGAETYFAELAGLQPGEIYVSDVIGAYVGSNYIGMYTEGTVAAAAEQRGYDIEYAPEAQAYAGVENPNGQRFEGIIRWATPVTDSSGQVTGYVSFALNHDHIMEFVDHITPKNERYTELPNAYEGNYAFIWDYKCRNICHPRHHSIAGYDPQTGDPQVPWLETSIYDAWQQSGVEKWTDFIADYPEFNKQSRGNKPAPALTRAGMVGLDGRYLNNAPQCTGWMDLTENGGSGSFYILWSGLYKLTTAGAIPYYTGRYAPSEENNYSLRGFGFVAIGAGLEDFTSPARATETRLTAAAEKSLQDTNSRLIGTTIALIALVVLVAIWLASSLTGRITALITGISRFKGGERQFRFNTAEIDEFGTLADSFDEMADSIVDSVSSPLTITDMDQKIIYMNEQGLGYNKKTLDEVIGQSYREISIYPFGSQYCPITALERGREAEVYYQEGSGHYFKGVANYLTDRAGNKKGYIITTQDVTEIELARKRAEQGSRAKSDFLSNMSHEMRTPMNAIIGMSAIGKNAPSLERKDYAFGKIDDASTHLLGVINDILDMSKIEANKFELSVAEFNFERIMQKVVNVINFRIEEKQQRFVVRIDQNIPVTLIGDEQRITQVVMNLLSNAVKFTPAGGTIKLKARFLGEEDGNCSIQIDVTDTGIGISPEQQSRLFNSFEQAESSTSRKFGGTGLGLVISKNIVEMMNGNIWIESELGKGSKFSFTIQVKRGSRTSHLPENSLVDYSKIRILVVDDAPETLEYFAETTKRLGVVCDTALDGESALAMLEKAGRYDICFVDWRMPEMDGIELSRRIKTDCGEAVVIMISAMEWGTIEKEAKDAGVARFLSKPLFASDIADCICDFVGGNKPEEDKGGAVAEDFTGHCILLAEDVEINREIVLSILEPTGLAIDCAENGEEAVELFNRHPEKYEMIFMDLQMPVMDGFEATRFIRAVGSARAKDIPIIAMTANVFREDIEKCMEVGMNGHIGKPLDFNEVVETLNKYLG